MKRMFFVLVVLCVAALPAAASDLPVSDLPAAAERVDDLEEVNMEGEEICPAEADQEAIEALDLGGPEKSYKIGGRCQTLDDCPCPTPSLCACTPTPFGFGICQCSSQCSG